MVMLFYFTQLQAPDVQVTLLAHPKHVPVVTCLTRACGDYQGESAFVTALMCGQPSPEHRGGLTRPTT